MDAWRWREAVLLLVALQIPFGHAVGSGLVLLVLWLGERFSREPLWKPTMLDSGFWSLIGISTLSALASPWRSRALGSTLLLFVAAYVMLRASVLSTERTPAFARRFLYAWAVGGTLAGLVAIATFGRALDARASLPGLGYNALGTTLAVTFIALLGLATSGSRGSRVACIAALPVVAGGLALTFSRGAWLGVALGGLVLAACLGWRRLWPGGMALLVVAIVSLTVLAPRWQWHLARLQSLALGAGQPNRLAVWKAVPAIVARHPLLGTGVSTFPLAYASYGRDAASDDPPFAHNMILNAAVETGLAGLGALLLLLASGILAALRWFKRLATPNPHRVASGTALAALVTVLGHQLVDGTVMGVHLAIGLFALLGIGAGGELATRTPMEECS